MYCVILETYATWPSLASGTGKYTGWVGVVGWVVLCQQHHLGLPRGCTLQWHLGGGNGIVNISYRRVIVRWVFADHQMMSPSMGWQYRQHWLWKIHLRYISWGVPCHDILDALGWTFWGGVVSPRPSGICCSMTSGRGQLHRQYRLWKKHLEVGVVSPASAGAGVWTQLPGLPDRLALGACRSQPVRQLSLVTGGLTPNVSAVVDTVNLETQLGGLVPSRTAAEEHWWHKTHALDIFGYAWYDPLGVGQVFHVSKWTLAGDDRNPCTRRMQLDRHLSACLNGHKTIWRIVTVTNSCTISHSEKHGSLGHRQPALCPHRRAGEFYITDQRAGWSRLAGQVRCNVYPIWMKPGI